MTEQNNSGSIVDRGQVKVARESVRIGQALHSGTGHGEPKIDLIRDGETIRAIEITCRCGERIRLLCDYD
jgi:chromosome condensin MukBEF MukE localization factor